MTERSIGATALAKSATGVSAMDSTSMIATSRRGVDPRTKLLLMLLVAIVVMSPAGMPFVPWAILLAIVLAASERSWSRIVTIVATAAGLYLFGWVLPSLFPSAVLTIVAVGCGFAMRFVAAFGVGAYLISSTSPTQLSGALRAWHAPRAIGVTLAVMLRFFPVVASESAAVLDAMRLRGLVGATGILRHPILAIERFTVPMIAASLRASEDLSASAILRGLGSRTRPISMYPPRFGLRDLALVAFVCVLALAGILLPKVFGTVIS